MNVRDILNDKGSDVFTVNEAAPLKDAIAVLNGKNIGVVLVVDKDSCLKGILSERDIIRRSLARETGFRDEPVTKSMTRNVLTVGKTASVDEVMEIMSNSRIRHIPVMDGDTIAGLVSIGDVVKRKIAEAEGEAEALRDYIATG